MAYVYVINREEEPSESVTGRYHSARSGRLRWLRPRSRRLFRRGTVRHARWRANGDPADLREALRDLSEAAWGRALTVRDMDRRPRHWAAYANNFGVALLDEYQRTEKTQVLDTAVVFLRESLAALTEDSPARARALTNLIAAVTARADLPEEAEDLPDLSGLQRDLSETTSAPALARLAAASAYGYAAADRDGPAAGLDGLGAAVELLPRAAWWGHSRTTREDVLADHTGLATDAAACAIEAGRPARALELLEGGRAVLWQQLLRTRADRTRLYEVAPRLARRMDKLAATLERDGGMPADRRMALVHRWEKLEDRAQARSQREWTALAGRAQQALPDAVFTLPAFGADLAPAGAEGPVVVVNVSRLGCAALIVEDGTREPRTVALPDLTHDEAHARARRYVAAMADGQEDGREQVVGETLEWLWRVIAEPVLHALEGGAEHDGESRPRLWWCPTGPLATLPLHAAARQTPGEPSEAAGAGVLDRVVPSYTPTLLVLVRAREQRGVAERSEEHRLLHVTVSEAAGQASLPGVARTSAHLAELLPADRRTSLEGAAATRESVRAQLERHLWAHFDCHGVQDLDQPFLGGLVLHDRTLTVADLAGIRHDRAEFAFLAACSTAVGGTRLPDEVITLTSALQHSGYQEVIGTLWSVPDRSAVRVTRTLYDQLALDGRLLPSRSARALHKAVCAERERLPEHPSAWVPFLHVGL
ncbi:CHAT domain-containing protein [Streptomyces coerulescens]|uniref:CHAT domain-containing protein n=1 Tax=Streptomyces coerulescens TaxID=29304 RepID=A0ABW0CT81_STRCD